MNKKALIIDNVCIDYRILNHMSIQKSLMRKRDKKNNELFHAITNVSFSVNEGEIVGIIGRNGSGKSTLLRAIAGIFRPDSGTINTMGHRLSLMSIGVGFKPDISGRDNIITSGMLLGYKSDFIYEKMDEIIEFSELGNFIDRPVRTYSSGMYSKLSFSITAIMDPDVMLVDEVLSVGDAKFRKKSFNKMRELILDERRTVLIVSHDMTTLKSLCSRVIWLCDGKIKKIGSPIEILDEYEKEIEEKITNKERK